MTDKTISQEDALRLIKDEVGFSGELKLLSRLFDYCDNIMPNIYYKDIQEKNGVKLTGYMKKNIDKIKK